jgi:hypothetical protein
MRGSNDWIILYGAWLPTEITSLLARLTPESLSYNGPFTYLDLMQNRVMTLQIPESCFRDRSAGYGEKSSTSATEIKAVHSIFLQWENTNHANMNYTIVWNFQGRDPPIKNSDPRTGHSPFRCRKRKKSKEHSSKCGATYNVELRQLSLFHGTTSHVLRH